MKHRVWFVILLTLSVSAIAGVFSHAAAQAPGPFAIDQVLSHPFAGQLTASQTGSMVAWMLNERGRRNIYVAGGPAFAPRRLTNYTEDDGLDLANLSFSGDGRYLVFDRDIKREAAADGAAGKPPADRIVGARPPAREVWSVAIADGALKRLGEGEMPVVAPRTNRVAFLRNGHIWIAPVDASTPAEAVYARGTSEGLTWSPDGETLAFASNRDSHAFITLFTRADQPVAYVAPSTSRDSRPVWSPDGSQLAFFRQPGQGRASAYLGQESLTIWVSTVRSGTAREVWKSGSPRLDALLSADAGAALRWGAVDRLVFLSYQDGWPHVYSVPAAGGPALLLTPGPFMVDRMSLSPDRRTIVYSANGGPEAEDLDRRHVFRVAVDDARPIQLTIGRGIEWNPVLADEGRTLAYLTSDAVHGSLPAIQPIDGGERRALAADRVPADFPTSRLVAPESVLLRGKDGVELHGQVFKASGRDTPGPALLFVHDEPAEQMLLGWHYSYRHAVAYAVNQYLASRGFLVLSLNYRSGIGYGHTFQYPELPGAPRDYDDLISAAEYLRTRPDVDPKRVGIWGVAYGGYLTAVALARNSPAFAAAADVDGAPNMILQEIRNLTVTSDDCDEKVTVTPLHWTSPALIMHSDDDGGGVRFRLSEQLDRDLREQGAPIESRLIPGDTSQLLIFTSWTTIATSVTEYFERVLKP